MKKSTFLILGGISLFLSILVSCNKSNSSTPLPSMMSYLINQNWRLDTVILTEDTGEDTLTMADVPGFSTSYIKFYNRLDSSFVFRDVLNSALTGPDSRDSIFRYAYGRWSLSAAEDSIYLYSQDTVKAKGYLASWAVTRVDSTSLLYADYVDTVARSGGDTAFLRKRAVFVKSTFY